jgi:hypothetical protein
MAFRNWNVRRCVKIATRGSAILAVPVACATDKAYSLTDEEMRLVNKDEFDIKVSKFASHAKTFITKPEENKHLARCFSNRNDDPVKLYYPTTSSGKFYDDSKCSYARVATTTVNGSIPQITDLIFDGNPEKKSQWNRKQCLQDEQLLLVSKFDLEESEPGASHFGELPKQGLVVKKPAGVVSKVASAGANIHFYYSQSMCAGGLRPREFYSWHHKCPGATVGLYDNFNTVCLIELDACRNPSLFKDKNQMRAVVPEKSLSTTAVRGHFNSCLVLEYIAPEKTRVTYLAELDPNIYLLYPSAGSDGGWLGWLSGTFQYLLYMRGADETFVMSMLRALKQQVEGASQEEAGLSVEDAAKIRFKKQLTTHEQQQLSANLAMTSSAEMVTDEVIKDQEALVALLTKKLADVLKEERSATASSPVPKEFYTSMRERIERDLKTACEKLNSLRALQQK